MTNQVFSLLIPKQRSYITKQQIGTARIFSYHLKPQLDQRDGDDKSLGVTRTQFRVAPDWDLWRTAYRVSNSAKLNEAEWAKRTETWNFSQIMPLLPQHLSVLGRVLGERHDVLKMEIVLVKLKMEANLNCSNAEIKLTREI